MIKVKEYLMKSSKFKKRIYNALLESSSEEVVNFDNVLKKDNQWINLMHIY